jgi:hypothetical protein
MASDRWDDLLSDSTWYVPAANLLAYKLDFTSPETPIPAADQTIWHRRLCSSITFRNLSLRPSAVASNWKSMAHTWWGCWAR